MASIYNSRNSKDLIVGIYGFEVIAIYNSRNSKDLIVLREGNAGRLESTTVEIQKT